MAERYHTPAIHIRAAKVGQEAGGDVEYLDEANERHKDFVLAGGMAAFEDGTPEAEAAARVSAEADAASTAAAPAAGGSGRPPRAPSATGGMDSGTQRAIRLPPSAGGGGGESKSSSSNVSSSRKVLMTPEEIEIDRLVSERLRMEEEKIALHRALSEMKLEEQRLRNKARIQERLAARRKKRAMKNGEPGENLKVSKSRGGLEQSSEYFAMLQARQEESRLRTAKRLSKRRNSAKRKNEEARAITGAGRYSRRLDTLEARQFELTQSLARIARMLAMNGANLCEV